MADNGSMPLLHEQATNHGVLRYLGQGIDPGGVAAEPAPRDVDTWRLGAHPDVVELLWTRLNTALPRDARYLVAGGAALVHPESGLILAAALGTQYALRLSGDGLATAQAAGYQTVHTFRSVDRTLDLAATFGPGWVFGRHDEQEGTWLAESYLAANL
jgi:hypothetical protein